MVYLDQNFKIKWCLEAKWSDNYFEQIDDLKGLLTFCQYNKPSRVQVTTKTKNGYREKKGVQIEFKESAIVCYNIGRKRLMSFDIQDS